MHNLSIDIESYSETELKTSGVYRYAEDAAFEILLFSYSVDGGEVQTVDLAQGENIPPEVLEALTDDDVTKWAYNASFERVCLSRYLRDRGVSLDPFADNHFSSEYLGKAQYLNPASWRCSMVWAAYLGLPLSLEQAGAALGLDKQKLTEGKEIIRYFCKPCNPTIKNGQRTRNLPHHDPDRWASFKSYNKRDVETEMGIQTRLAKFPVPDDLWEQYCQDQEINDRGVALDMELVENAIKCEQQTKSTLKNELYALTHLSNPNSVAQMKDWLAKHGLEMDTLGKKAVAEALTDAPPELVRVLELRQQIAKSSVRKYQAMRNAVCADGRAHGMFQFYGANRTGRWAGRLIQLQNLPQNHLADLDAARQFVRMGDFGGLKLNYKDSLQALSELVRTAFVPKSASPARVGCKFIVADFSAIEARVIAWLAGEKWRNEVFATHGKIYEASASQMFHVPIEEITKTSPLRQKGKIAELALGYGGSVGALKAMGALEMGLDEDELQPLVSAWRLANPNIKKLWYDFDRAAILAVSQKTTTASHGIKFQYQSGMLFVTLPSGRRLAYVKPKIETNRFGMDSITYMGVGDTKRWERLETYGAKLCENVVQAISRDILAHAMQRFRHCDIVMHVHDEIVIEADKRMSLEVVCKQMSETPPWAEGGSPAGRLLLRADGYECNYYKKD